MSDYVEKIKSICSPAKLYLGLALIGVVVHSILMLSTNKFDIRAIMPILVIPLIFIIGWTILLNFICTRGYTELSWALVLFPYFLILAINAAVFLGGLNYPSQFGLSVYATAIIVIAFSMMKKK